MPRVIWCYATKHQIAVAPASNQLTGESDDPVEIVLKPSTDTRFEVRNLQGDPIRGARVEPGLFLERAAREMVPTELREVVGAETNDRGVALLPAMGRDFPPIRVTAPGYGVQELQWRGSAEEPAVRTVRLSPTGRLEGRLLCDDPSEFEGLRVCIDTDQPRRSDEVAVAAGFAEVDEQGRFVFPECAEGPIRLLIPIVEPGAWAPRIPENLEIKAGETTEVEVPFGRTVRVRGRVQVKETEVPVAPAGVSVWYGSEWFQRNRVRTDADGRFETNVLPGEVQQHLIMKPEEYSNWVMEAPDRRTPIQVPAGVETFDLPPVNLIPTVEHSGRLVDRENRPVTEACIHAIAKDRCSYSAKIDESGAFTLHLPKGFEIEKYEVARSREDSPVPTAVLSESPLVLQSVEEKTPVPPAPPAAEKTTPVPLNSFPARKAANAALAKTVHGKVVDENGTPISGADVWMMPVYDPVKENPAAHVTTDAQGQFTLAVHALSDRDLKRVGWPYRRDLILAYADGRQLGTAEAYEQMAGHDKSDLIIRLKPAAKTEFVVLGPDGKPKAGAVIEPRYPRNPHLELPREICARVAARTDAEGRAVLTAFPRDAINCIDVVTDDLGIQSEHLIPRSGGGLKGSGGGMAFPVGLYAGQPIRLRQGGTIVGRITADKPEWTRGVRVMVTTSSRYMPARSTAGSPIAPDRFKDTGISTTTGFADVVSDEHGRFEIPVIAAGSMIINAVVDDRLPVLPIEPDGSAVDLRSRPGETTEMEIPLVRTIPAVGSVRIEKTGQPIPGAVVQIARGTDLMQDMLTITDAEGNYTASVLPGKNAVGMTLPPGYRHLRPGVRLECEVPEDAKEYRIPVIKVGEKKTGGDSSNGPSNPPHPQRADSPQASSAGPEIPEILIHGCVGDESGEPIVGAKLWLPLKHEDDKRLAKAVTDEAGLFTLRVPTAWIEPGARTMPGVIWCYAPDHRIAAVSAFDRIEERSDTPIEIVLGPSTDTRFEVKNLEGDSIRGARVEPMHLLFGTSGCDIPSPLRKIISATTDDRGIALLPAMGREDFPRVRVTTPGYGVQKLRLGCSAKEPAVRRIRLSPTGRLEGRLLCEDKSVLEGLRVHILQDESPEWGFPHEYATAAGSVEVDETGRFVFPECAEGAVRLEILIEQPGAWAPRIPKKVEVESGETTKVEIPFERTVRVRGHVKIKETGKPVADAMMSVSYGDSCSQGNWVRTGADGRFETNVLAGEILQHLIKPKGYSSWTVGPSGHPTPIKVPPDAKTFDLPTLELVAPGRSREAIDKGMKADELERSRGGLYRY